MASWKSNQGIWEPSDERAVNIKTGEVYEGKDRSATEFLKEEGVTYIGMDVRKDPDNIMRARQLGMTVEDFLALNTPPSPETQANEDAKKVLVVTHIDPKPKRGVKPQGGGVNMTGDFGDIPK